MINDKQTRIWGQAINLPLSQVPLIFGQTSITLQIQITGDGFDIFIEDKHCARLEHRKELPSEPCSLFLQFPSSDDYGSPENWSVYKTWWGNKPIMAKGDLAGIPGVNSFNAIHPVRTTSTKIMEKWAKRFGNQYLQRTLSCYSENSSSADYPRFKPRLKSTFGVPSWSVPFASMEAHVGSLVLSRPTLHLLLWKWRMNEWQIWLWLKCLPSTKLIAHDGVVMRLFKKREQQTRPRNKE